MLPRDEPPAPANGKGRPMIRRVRRSVHRHPVGSWIDAADEHSRDEVRGVGGMAGDARVVALEFRRPGWRLRKRVEDRSELRVLSDELEHFAATHPPDGYRIVEVDRTRV